MTTTRPIKKMMPIVLPEELEHAARIAAARKTVCKGIGSREWDRTTDHLHVKEVLYH